MGLIGSFAGGMAPGLEKMGITMLEGQQREKLAAQEAVSRENLMKMELQAREDMQARAEDRGVARQRATGTEVTANQAEILAPRQAGIDKAMSEVTAQGDPGSLTASDYAAGKVPLSEGLISQAKQFVNDQSGITPLEKLEALKVAAQKTGDPAQMQRADTEYNNYRQRETGDAQVDRQMKQNQMNHDESMATISAANSRAAEHEKSQVIRERVSAMSTALHSNIQERKNLESAISGDQVKLQTAYDETGKPPVRAAILQRIKDNEEARATLLAQATQMSGTLKTYGESGTLKEYQMPEVKPVDEGRVVRNHKTGETGRIFSDGRVVVDEKPGAARKVAHPADMSGKVSGDASKTSVPQRAQIDSEMDSINSKIDASGNPIIKNSISVHDARNLNNRRDELLKQMGAGGSNPLKTYLESRGQKVRTTNLSSGIISR